MSTHQSKLETHQVVNPKSNSVENLKYIYIYNQLQYDGNTICYNYSIPLALRNEVIKSMSKYQELEYNCKLFLEL